MKKHRAPPRKGETIASSPPYIFRQTLESRKFAASCANCGIFLSSIDFQLAFSLNNSSRRTNKDRNGSSLICYCPRRGCHEMYCSEKCMHGDRIFGGHWMTCSGYDPNGRSCSNLTKVFSNHALSTNELFLTAFHILGRVASDAIVDSLECVLDPPRSQDIEKPVIEAIREQLQWLQSEFPCYGRTLWGSISSSGTSKDNRTGGVIENDNEQRTSVSASTLELLSSSSAISASAAAAVESQAMESWTLLRGLLLYEKNSMRVVYRDYVGSDGTEKHDTPAHFSVIDIRPATDDDANTTSGSSSLNIETKNNKEYSITLNIGKCLAEVLSFTEYAKLLGSLERHLVTLSIDSPLAAVAKNIPQLSTLRERATALRFLSRIVRVVPGPGVAQLIHDDNQTESSDNIWKDGLECLPKDCFSPQPTIKQQDVAAIAVISESKVSDLYTNDSSMNETVVERSCVRLAQAAALPYSAVTVTSTAISTPEVAVDSIPTENPFSRLAFVAMALVPSLGVIHCPCDLCAYCPTSSRVPEMDADEKVDYGRKRRRITNAVNTGYSAGEDAVDNDNGSTISAIYRLRKSQIHLSRDGLNIHIRHSCVPNAQLEGYLDPEIGLMTRLIALRDLRVTEHSQKCAEAGSRTTAEISSVTVGGDHSPVISVDAGAHDSGIIEEITCSAIEHSDESLTSRIQQLENRFPHEQVHASAAATTDLIDGSSSNDNRDLHVLTVCKCERCILDSNAENLFAIKQLTSSADSTHIKELICTLLTPAQLRALADQAMQEGRLHWAVSLYTATILSIQQLHSGTVANNNGNSDGNCHQIEKKRNMESVPEFVVQDHASHQQILGDAYHGLGAALLDCRMKVIMHGKFENGRVDCNKGLTADEGTVLAPSKTGCWVEGHKVWRRGVKHASYHTGLKEQVLKLDAYSYWRFSPLHIGAVYDLQRDFYSFCPESFYRPTPKSDSRLLAKSLPHQKQEQRQQQQLQHRVYMTKSPLLSKEECKQAIRWAEKHAAANCGGSWTTSRHYAVPTTDLPIHEMPQFLGWLNELMKERIDPMLRAQFFSQQQQEQQTLKGRIAVNDAFIVKYQHIPIPPSKCMSSGSRSSSNSSSDSNNGSYSSVDTITGGNCSDGNPRDECILDDLFCADGSLRDTSMPLSQRHLPLHTDQSTHSIVIALNDKSEYTGGGTYFADIDVAIRPDVGHVLSFPGDVVHGGDPVLQGTRYIIALFLYLDEDAEPEEPEELDDGEKGRASNDVHAESQLTEVLGRGNVPDHVYVARFLGAHSVFSKQKGGNQKAAGQEHDKGYSGDNNDHNCYNKTADRCSQNLAAGIFNSGSSSVAEAESKGSMFSFGFDFS